MIALEITALIIAVCALINSMRYNQLIKGQVELQIRARISSARNRYEDILLQSLTLRLDEDQDALLKGLIRSTKEEYSNAYNEACEKYLDKKVDTTRFKQSYSNEIYNIVNDPSFSDQYIKPQTKFKATVKVYDEWFDLEK